MIHADSVKAWEAESETFRGIIAEQRKEIERLRSEARNIFLDRAAHQQEIERLRVHNERLSARVKQLHDLLAGGNEDFYVPGPGEKRLT